MSSQRLKTCEVRLPRGCRPTDLLVLRSKSGPPTISYVELPEGATPGSYVQIRLPVAPGSDEPSMDVTYIPVPQAKDEVQMFEGFQGLPSPTAGKRLSSWPLIVIRAPPPRAGESLISGLLGTPSCPRAIHHRASTQPASSRHGLPKSRSRPCPRPRRPRRPSCAERWSEFDIVEINGVPQPMAYVKPTGRGHSFEEFFLLNNVPADRNGLPRTPTTDAGLFTTHHFLRLVHKQTRTVGDDRVFEWRKGIHWQLRMPNEDGRELMILTDLAKHLKHKGTWPRRPNSRAPCSQALGARC